SLVQQGCSKLALHTPPLFAPSWRTIISKIDDVGIELRRIPELLPPKNEPPHVQITEQRRDRRPLRDALPGVPGFGRSMLMSSIVLFFDRHHKPLFNEMQHMPITDTSGHRRQQLRMRDAVKVSG